MWNITRLLVIPIVLLIAACSYNRPDIIIPINPQVDVVNSKLGDQQTIAVQVSDQRKQSTIGFTNGMEALTGNSVWIKTAADLVPAVQQKLAQGIQAQGFASATNAVDVNRTLKANILSITYQQKNDGDSSKHYFSAKVEVIATNYDKTFTRVYTGETTFSTPWFLSNKQLVNYTNQTIAVVLNNIFSDGELWSFLH